MIPCRSCQQPVAEDANTCPHCGAPNPNPMRVGTVAGCLIILLATLLIFWLVG